MPPTVAEPVLFRDDDVIPGDDVDANLTDLTSSTLLTALSLDGLRDIFVSSTLATFDRSFASSSKLLSRLKTSLFFITLRN